MSSVPINSFEAISMVFNLEVRSINGERISKDELIKAIEHDVAHYLPVSKTALFKHVSGNPEFTRTDFTHLATILQHGVIRAFDISHDAALSYAHAAIICGSEASKL
jgi:hypothetical protein